MSPFSNDPQRNVLEGELASGEVLVWFGKPDPLRLRQRATPTFLWSFPLGGFMTFWMWGATEPVRRSWASSKTPEFFTLLFPAFGLFMVFPFLSGLSAPWREEARAKRMLYGITNQRALIVEVGRKRLVRTVSPPELSVERVDLPGGKGDLVLKRETKGRGEDATTEVVGFWGIENAREVERLLRDTLQRSN